KSKDSEADISGKSTNASASARKKLKLIVQYATQTNDAPRRPTFRKWVKAALTQDAEITLRVVDEEEGRRLNREFRGKDYPTNVLTFDYGSDYGRDCFASHSPLSGDIVLCAPVIENEVQQQRKDRQSHYAHLTIHAILHLQGYTHDEESEAEIMEKLEIE